MSYLELYKKYRPRDFETVIGQDATVKSLKESIINNTIPTAYLFSGTPGTGKTTLALILAKALNCENPKPDGNPCNECDKCVAIDKNSLLGVKYMSMSENGSVDSVRALMDESRLSQPIKKKVFILDEAHNLSPAAQDAMLIGLEDEKQSTLFILCSTDPEKIKPAILSRVQHRRLREPSVKELLNRLIWIIKQEPEILPKFKSGEFTKDALSQCAIIAGGSVRNAISNLESLLASGSVPVEFSTKLLEAISNGDIISVYNIITQMTQEGVNLNKTAEIIYKSLIDIFKHLNGAELENASLSDISNKLNTKLVIFMIDTLGQTLNNVNNKVIDYRILYEVCFTRMTLTIKKQKANADK